jgi:hypothetical protein
MGHSMTLSIASLLEEPARRLWKQSSTFRRLIFSRHVMDLQAIFVVTLLAPLVLLASGQLLDHQSLGAVLLICGTILAWTYQTGSKRLGVVDLFACEIVTLCRVGALMEVVKRLISAHEGLSGLSASVAAPDASHQDIKLGRFTSQENYFPVFEQNTKDLQVLEADVVINVTAFYTYMKAFRDQLRALSELGSGEELKHQKSALLVNAIYMIFLGYESARKSIDELIEFEPTQAEALVTALVIELPAYRFLTTCFGPDDIRGRRLALREDKYGEFVPQLYEKVMRTETTDWENARTTAIDLERLYNSLGFTPKITATS